jgi:hypothetical protein
MRECKHKNAHCSAPLDPIMPTRLTEGDQCKPFYCGWR